jgi:hypothetical protein
MIATSSSSGDGEQSSTSSSSGGYKFFEDMYPKHDPPPQYASYEDQCNAATVKNLEPKVQLGESEKLHKLHEWEKSDKGYAAPENYGWADEWGPEPGEEGHQAWYNKNRVYMSYEEKAKYDMRHSVPLEKGAMRHHEMPLTKRIKAGYWNLQNEKPQWFDSRERDYWAEYGYEDKRDYVVKAKDDYVSEWLEKPGVTPNNVAKKIADYNGTAKHQRVVPVARKPEWELAPVKSDDD